MYSGGSFSFGGDHSFLHSNNLAKKYPFYGVQWHPEKSGYEWNTKETINHSQHAVTIMQMAANFFVSEGEYCNNYAFGVWVL